MSELRVIEQFPDRPITEQVIIDDLRALGIEPGAIVLVHTRLSAIGWVCGDALAVIRALQECVRGFGTLVMPTHSGGLTDPATWENPPVPASWCDTIRDTMPAYEPEVTPTRGVGRTPDLFRTLPLVLRSNHPHVSFAAWGEHALDIVADHDLEFSLGEGSPLARLYDADAWVLLIGAGFDSNTSFHLAEYRADYAKKETVLIGAPVMIDGHRRWKTFRDINYESDDFAEIGRAFVKRHKQEVRIGRVGNAESHLFRQRIAVDFAAQWMHTHRR
ncbi:MAG: aminoglycoside N(3)-acetyltransferase [Spirochaetaceae bacterium]|nr:MAG: aminoglycoside N(3)-acetyltransferase [Spirochaetaceae bacterium]